MSKIEWTVEKRTFIPEKNYFKCENVRVFRDESQEEVDLYDKMHHYDSLAFTWAAILGLGGFLGAIIIGALLCNFAPKPCGIIVTLFFIAACFSSIPTFRILAGKSDHYCKLWEQYKKEHDVWNASSSAMEVQAWNEEQEKIAEVWRTEHPFEEQIRQCLLDPKSSVDIAKAAIIYVENYFNKEN